jgi:hypothetical protein
MMFKRTPRPSTKKCADHAIPRATTGLRSLAASLQVGLDQIKQSISVAHIDISDDNSNLNAPQAMERHGGGTRNTACRRDYPSAHVVLPLRAPNAPISEINATD